MTRPLAVAVGILVIVLLSRAPFASQTLWAHDSALYAAALERGFHVDDALSQQRPHPPGYLLYVMAAGAARLAGLDSNSALVLVSAVASALAAAALFLLARRWMREPFALLTAAAFAASPLVWQYSEIAYPYTALALVSIVVAWACLLARGSSRGTLVAAVVYGIAAGVRQDLLVLLAPLWLWTIAPLGWRGAVQACAAVAASCLVWLVPTAMLSGGPLAYVESLTSQVAYVRATYSVEMRGVPALLANAAATGWALAWGLTTMGLFAATAFVTRSARLGADARFLALWTMPAVAIYVLLHIGEWGYVLSVLPGLYLIAGGALDDVARSAARPRVLPAAWTTLVVAPALAFVLGTFPFSASAIAAHDNELSARVAYVREQYDPRSTLILTREDHLLVRYYLPQFRARQYDPEPFARGSRRVRTGRVERIVVFTPGLVPEQRPDVRKARCRGGVELVYLDVIPGAVLEFRGERYAVGSAAP